MTDGAWDVQVTRLAHADVREAACYMRDALLSPKAARDFVETFAAQVDALRTFSEARPLVHDYELARRGYRWCPVGNFMLFFTVDASAHAVMIERVLYGARDWKSLV